MRKRSGRPQRFAAVPNETIDDAVSLDFMALALLTVLIRHRDGWDVTLEKIGKKYGYGREALSKAIGLLMAARYVVKVRMMSVRGNQWSTEVYVYDTPATDAEIEALLTAVENDDEVVRAEVIQPTKAALEHARKRREKVAPEQRQQRNRPSVAVPNLAAPEAGAVGRQQLVGSGPSFAGKSLKERGYVYLAFSAQYNAFKVGTCRSDRYAARMGEHAAAGWEPIERKEFPTHQQARRLEQDALGYLRDECGLLPAVGAEEMRLGWSETFSATDVTREGLWAVLAAGHRASPSAGNPALGSDQHVSLPENESPQVGPECRDSRQSGDPAVFKKTVGQKTVDETVGVPSARSAGGVRSTSTSGGSSAESESGFAAAGKEGSASDEDDGTAGVPGPRQPAETEWSREQLAAVRAVEALLPPVLLDRLPYRQFPKRNRPAVLQALESRTLEQLRERVERRWVAYGYEPALYDGTLTQPVGAALELIVPPRYCPDLSCEDGLMVDTGAECRVCLERRARRRAARVAGELGSVKDSSNKGAGSGMAPECVICQAPFPGAVPESGECRRCREETAAAVAALDAFLEPAPAASPIQGHPVIEDVETARLCAEYARQYGTPDQVAAYCGAMGGGSYGPAPF